MNNKLITTLLAFLGTSLVAGVVMAQESSGILQKGDGQFVAIAVAIGIGLAAFAGAFGQGRTASAALEGIARNPSAADRLFVPMILGLAFIESLVLFTWVLMFLLQDKL